MNKNNNLKTSIDFIKQSIYDERQSKEDDSSHIRLINSIGDINSAFRNNWMVEKYPDVKSCAAILKDDFAFPLPVLSVCGHGTREIRYTQYLAYLLNPKNPHGLEAHFLYGIFREKFEQEGIQKSDMQNTTATAEVALDVEGMQQVGRSSTCDVVVENNQFALFIEQKINASENMDSETKTPQLKKYSKAISANPKYENKKIFKYYLTPNGKEPTERDWIQISHKELIEVGLSILENKVLSKTAKQNLVRYLMDIAVGPYTGTEANLNKLKNITTKIVKSIEDQPGTFPKGDLIMFHDLFKKNEALLNVIREEKKIYEND